MSRNYEKEVEKMLKTQKTCVVGSVDADGLPNIKAMLRPRKTLGMKTFYFSTNTSSEHVKQYGDNPKASVYFHRRWCCFKGILLKGTMEVLVDADIKKMLWEKGDDKYYPKGENDPDYCVLRFSADSGRMYSRLKSYDFTVKE